MQIQIQSVWAWTWDSAFLINSQVVLGLLVQGPHLEQWGLGGGKVPYLTANLEGSREEKTLRRQHRKPWRCVHFLSAFARTPGDRNTLECEERAKQERTNWWSSTQFTELMNLGSQSSWRNRGVTSGLSPRLSFMTLSYYLCNKALLLAHSLLPRWWNRRYVLWYTVRGERGS